MNQHKKLEASDRVGTAAREAAQAAWDNGGSPRAQLDAARSATGEKFGYLPHQGMRQRERALARLAKTNPNAD